MTGVSDDGSDSDDRSDSDGRSDVIWRRVTDHGDSDDRDDMGDRVDSLDHPSLISPLLPVFNVTPVTSL